MIKWNMLCIFYNKLDTQFILLKQNSLEIIRNSFWFCSIWTTFQQCRRSCWPLRDCCCWRTVLPVFFFVEHKGLFCRTHHLQVVKRCWWKGGINTQPKNGVYIQLVIFPVEFEIVQIRHLIAAGVHILCTYSWRHFVSYLYGPFLVGGV